MKSYRLAWTVSILVIAAVTVAGVICSFANVRVPDALTRTAGILVLASLAVLAFTTVKLEIWKRQTRGDDRNDR